MANEFDSEFSNVRYLEKEHIVFLKWKKFCCYDDYRNPTTFALNLLRENPGSNFVIDESGRLSAGEGISGRGSCINFIADNE